MTQDAAALELSKPLTPQAIAPDERQKVDAIAAQINLTDSQMVIQYGVGIQRNISTFADTILDQVRNKDSGHVGPLLTDLVQHVREVDVAGLDGKGFLAKVFSSLVDEAQRFIQRYEKIATQIDDLSDKLEQERLRLVRDVVMLDTLFDKNLDYFRELNRHILAGELKLEEARTKTLPALEAKAKAGSDMLDAQSANDFRQLISRFEKKVHDLKLSRTITLQSIPQIRIVQANNTDLAARIQSSILNTIPLWKNQIVLAVTLHRQSAAAKMQKSVTDTTNDLLAKNAELLKQSSIAVAQESERGIVDVETLKKVNDDLIATIEETIKIQAAGREKRAVAEKELAGIETQLRDKLVSVKGP